MGIFSKQSRAQSQRSATTLIAKGCAISGQFKLESDIQVDGEIEGEIHVAKTLVISQEGCIRGEIFADKVIVNGSLDGICHANSVEVLSQGQVSGTIYSDNLSIEQGGKFSGTTHPASSNQVVELKEMQAGKSDDPEILAQVNQ
ncbi:polymer-forming cytoskeletal protein [Vibrio sp. 03-59-1]|uniref:bactofilin family protein n=1 Tax=Vibrio sp. 03-59-1 TaxID=2607607 RepID=UPI0016A61F4B|nr:polymer-forming cytoskeletal protein [Vibrio sp. 03-59-1]NOH82391.1 polymer-forming cytoskeletal protein [Vibrio sp. 03-59-1]